MSVRVQKKPHIIEPVSGLHRVKYKRTAPRSRHPTKMSDSDVDSPPPPPPRRSVRLRKHARDRGGRDKLPRTAINTRDRASDDSDVESPPPLRRSKRRRTGAYNESIPTGIVCDTACGNIDIDIEHFYYLDPDWYPASVTQEIKYCDLIEDEYEDEDEDEDKDRLGGFIVYSDDSNDAYDDAYDDDSETTNSSSTICYEYFDVEHVNVPTSRRPDYLERRGPVCYGDCIRQPQRWPEGRNAKKINYLSSLPVELQLHILGFLDAADLAAVRGCSVGLKSYASDDILWKRFYLRDRATSPPFIDVESHASRISWRDTYIRRLRRMGPLCGISNQKVGSRLKVGTFVARSNKIVVSASTRRSEGPKYGVYSSTSGEFICPIRYDGIARFIAADGSYCVSADDRGRVHMWSSCDGNFVRDLHLGDAGPIVSADIHGNTLVVGSSRGAVATWSISDGTLLGFSSVIVSDGTSLILSSVTDERDADYDNTVYCVEISSDGTHVATGTRDGCVRIWRLSDMDLRMELELFQSGGVRAISLSPAIDVIAVVGGEDTALIYDCIGMKVIRRDRRRNVDSVFTDGDVYVAASNYHIRVMAVRDNPGIGKVLRYIRTQTKIDKFHVVAESGHIVVRELVTKELTVFRYRPRLCRRCGLRRPLEHPATSAGLAGESR